MGQDKTEESVQNILVMCVSRSCNYDLICATEKEQNNSGSSGNDVVKLGQHTVSIMQSKVHLIWNSPIIEKGLFRGWPAAGGADNSIVYWRSLRPAWFWVDKREQSGDSEEIPFIRLTSRQRDTGRGETWKDSTAGSGGHRGTASSADSLGPVAQPTCHSS